MNKIQTQHIPGVGLRGRNSVWAMAVHHDEGPLRSGWRERLPNQWDPGVHMPSLGRISPGDPDLTGSFYWWLAWQQHIRASQIRNIQKELSDCSKNLSFNINSKHWVYSILDLQFCIRLLLKKKIQTGWYVNHIFSSCPYICFILAFYTPTEVI